MKKTVRVAVLGLALGLGISGFAMASTIAVNGTAAQNGTSFGMQLNLTNPSTDAYVRTTHPVTETHYLMRFWVDPTGLPIAPGNAGSNHVRFFRLNDDGTDGDAQPRGVFLVGFFTKSADDGTYHMIFWAKQDGTTAFTSIGNLFLGPSPRQIEVEFTQNDSGSTSVVLKTLNAPAQTITRSNLNLGDADVDFADFGSFPNSNPSGIVGLYEFDEFESYR